MRLFRTENRSSVQTSSWPAAISTPSFAFLTFHNYMPNYPLLGGLVCMTASKLRRSKQTEAPLKKRQSACLLPLAEKTSEMQNVDKQKCLVTFHHWSEHKAVEFLTFLTRICFLIWLNTNSFGTMNHVNSRPLCRTGSQDSFGIHWLLLTDRKLFNTPTAFFTLAENFRENLTVNKDIWNRTIQWGMKVS